MVYADRSVRTVYELLGTGDSPSTWISWRLVQQYPSVLFELPGKGTALWPALYPVCDAPGHPGIARP
jgi:hypothetical protein